MGNWNNKYVEFFEKNPFPLNMEIINGIKENLDKKRCDNPLASIVMIAHNEENRILSSLWSLSDNVVDYPIEIIVIDNNSTDKTTQILDTLEINWHEEQRKGPGFARQAGLDIAKGKLYLCIDSDTIYPPQYINTHIKALLREGIVCASSTYGFIRDGKYSGIKLWCYEKLRDLYNLIQSVNRPELCVRGAVFSFNIEYGKKIGFKTNILRGEDGSLAFELMKNYGKYVYIRSSKGRAMTSSSYFDSKGSFSKGVMVQIKKGIRSIPSLFLKKRSYDDDKSNIINS